MEFRKAAPSDLNRIMEIIKDAQFYLKELGIDQWQNQYPSEETILTDIRNGHGYVLLEEGKIIATVAISFDGERTYEHIYDGAWLTHQDYAVIHRLAVGKASKGKGISNDIMKLAEELCKDRDIPSIKIDTHKHNVVMQHILQKNGYTYCGIIYVEDGSKRLAYEKRLT
ncbi:GNAT family N-acetyltransferase [Pradoshia sp.]